MKKKLIFVILGVLLLVFLFSIPSNMTVELNQSNDVEYAGIPPVKLPPLPKN